MNLYRYVNNKPLGEIDPFGLFTEDFVSRHTTPSQQALISASLASISAYTGRVAYVLVMVPEPTGGTKIGAVVFGLVSAITGYELYKNSWKASERLYQRMKEKFYIDNVFNSNLNFDTMTCLY